jgi:hypothetical protein
VRPSHLLPLSPTEAAGVVFEVVDLEVTAVIRPHQLTIQLPDAHLKAGILLKELSVALLDVLDGTVLDTCS